MKFQEGQTPPLKMAVDQWADKYRFMNETTGEKWWTDRMEVARGPMRAVTEEGVRTITVMCATQLLKTELILNTIGYFVHLDPCPMLNVQPKDEMARKFSNVRLKQMYKSTPVLRKRFVEEKSRDSSNTTQHKEFPGGHLDMVSASVPANLAMFSIRVVFLDEIDKYDESAGDEGDPVDLAEERMSKYSTNSLSIRVCSPTVKDMSRIEASYNESDKRKPFVKCAHCNHWQIMVWKNVRWEKDNDGNGIAETAQIHCEACGVAWTEFERLTTLKNISWRQTAEFSCKHCKEITKPQHWNGDDLDHWEYDEVNYVHRAKCENCGKGKCPNNHAGFWANKLYGQFRPVSDMAKLWLEVKGNIEKLKMFINTQLAETFEVAGEQIKDIEWLLAKREKYAAELPDEVGLITAGVDTQNNRLEIEVVGWGRDEESWQLEHKIIPGDPKNPETWKQLDEFFKRSYQRADGRVSYIAAAAIDMGGGHTQYVTNYCKHRINRRIWPIRGIGGDGKPYPVWPNNPSRGGKYNVPFYNIGVDSAKNVVFSRLYTEQPGAGYCHYPFSTSEDFFKQYTAEKRITKFKGSRKILVWENPRKARNEAFDLRVYAYSALCGLQQLGWNLNQLVDSQRLVLLSTKNKAESKQEDSHSQNSAKPKPSIQKAQRSKERVRSKFMSR